MILKYETRRQILLFTLALLIFFNVVRAQTPQNFSEAEKQLISRINVETIKDYTTSLSASEMQGRGTMQPGGDRAAQWIADKMKSFGLSPLGDKGSYFQKVEFKETVFTAETAFKLGEQNLRLGTDFAVAPFSAGNKSSSGDLVFVGYAMVVEAMKRNDLGNMNLQGKIVVMLEGPPPGITEQQWDDAKASQIFVQNLWRRGVSGIIVIGHGREKRPIEQYVDYYSRRQIDMADDPGSPPQMPLFVFAGKSGAEKLFEKSEKSLKDALALADTNDFKPIDLKQSAKITSRLKTTKGFSSNVAGLLEGSDPILKAETLVFTAHYDAYGIENDKIYYGAADNALGVSEMLAVAEAYSKMAVKPKRSIIFLAVTGEEYGLLGSKHWVRKPSWDVKKIAANLNLDGTGTEIFAPVKTFVGFGAEHSTIGTVFEDVSKSFGIKIIPDPMPEEKIFMRSDHYSFVERGIPAIKLLGAPAGDPQKWIERSDLWKKTDYHQPTDTIKPDWVWEGAEAVAEVMGVVGLRLADSPQMPSWLPSSPYGKLERGNTKTLPR